jgi:hypothetical protein
MTYYLLLLSICSLTIYYIYVGPSLLYTMRRRSIDVIPYIYNIYIYVFIGNNLIICIHNTIIHTYMWMLLTPAQQQQTLKMERWHLQHFKYWVKLKPCPVEVEIHPAAAIIGLVSYRVNPRRGTISFLKLTPTHSSLFFNDKPIFTSSFSLLLPWIPSATSTIMHRY